MNNLISLVRSCMGKKLLMGILALTCSFIFSGVSFATTSLSGYAYYTDLKSLEQFQIADGHYTLQFIWIDPSDASVHIKAGVGSSVAISYAADGSYSVEIPDEDAGLDFLGIIFPNDEKEDAFYASYHPGVMDIAYATSFIPNQTGGTFSPNGVGKEIVERPVSLGAAVTGNFIFKDNLRNNRNKISTIITLYNGNEIVNSTAVTENSYEITGYHGIFELVFNRPGYKTQSFSISIPENINSRIFQNVEFSRFIKNTSSLKPENYELKQNYPNPFNPTTNINFSLPKDSKVTLTVFDISGKEVARLLNNEFKTANSYSVTFNGIDLSSGVYFYKLETENFVDSKKMILVK